LAAEGHVKELDPARTLGHRGLTGSWPTYRANRYGTWKEALGETIYYDRDDAREVVMALIIDDGVSSRGHRRHIFDPAFRIVGMASGPHAIHESMCVYLRGQLIERTQGQVLKSRSSGSGDARFGCSKVASATFVGVNPNLAYFSSICFLTSFPISRHSVACELQL